MLPGRSLLRWRWPPRLLLCFLNVSKIPCLQEALADGAVLLSGEAAREALLW